MLRGVRRGVFVGVESKKEGYTVKPDTTVVIGRLIGTVYIPTVKEVSEKVVVECGSITKAEIYG